MNWTLILIGFALSVFMGSALVSLFATIWPEWSSRRKRLTAASILPAISAIATSLGVVFVKTVAHDQSGNMVDLAISALVTIGAGSTLLAWIGGLVGATLTSRRRG